MWGERKDERYDFKGIILNFLLIKWSYVIIKYFMLDVDGVDFERECKEKWSIVLFLGLFSLFLFIEGSLSLRLIVYFYLLG